MPTPSQLTALRHVPARVRVLNDRPFSSSMSRLPRPHALCLHVGDIGSVGHSRGGRGCGGQRRGQGFTHPPPFP
eukprot:scaffold39131_cov40-Phaeocystis_antarctica.AAC.2